MPAVLAVVLVHSLAFGIIYPVLPFRALALGADSSGVTLVPSVHLLLMLVAAPFWGWLSDRLGRQMVLGVNLAFAAVAYLLLGWVDSMTGVILARALAGLSAAVLPLAQATMADIVGPRDKARGMAMVMAAYGAAFVVGPLVAGFAADAFAANFMLAASASAGCSATALVIVVVFLGSGDRDTPAYARAMAPNPPPSVPLADSIHFLAPILFVFVFGFVYAGFDTTLALRVTDHFHWGAREVGYLFAIAGGATVISQIGVTPWLTRTLGESRCIAFAGAALLMGLAQASWSAVIGIGLAAAGIATGVVCLQSVISQVSRKAARGAALGIAHSALTLSRVLGPLWAGICFGVLGAGWFYVSGIVIVAAAVLLLPIAGFGWFGATPARATEGAR